jgi:hypothetical protein
MEIKADYRIELRPEKRAKLITKVEPVEKKKEIEKEKKNSHNWFA